MRENAKLAAKLPSFRRPPVVEVALGLQFEPLGSLKTPQLGLLWQRFRREFPVLEEHHPHPPVEEKSGPAAPTFREIRLQLLGEPVVSRCLFVSAAGTELIQVQQDRFVFNWRKQEGTEKYPRYAYVRKAFVEHLNIFRNFLEEERVGELVPTQWEVSYVNQIMAGEGWGSTDELEAVIPSWSLKYSDDFLPSPEDIRFNIRYVIAAATGTSPLGRLYVSLEPIYRPAVSRPAYSLRLTARGSVRGGTLDDAFALFDTGREWIVRGFASITSKIMHDMWQREA